MADWTFKPLGDVCTLQRGFDLPTQDRRPGAYPLVSSSGVVDTHDEGKVQGPGVITGRSGSIGSVFYVEEDFWPLNTALYVRDFHDNYPRFVYYLLTAFDLKRYAGGTGVPTLNRNDIHNVTVLVPDSVKEQRRIVAILDEAFAAIATAKANTEKSLTGLEDAAHAAQRLYLMNGSGDWSTTTLGNIGKVSMCKRVFKEETSATGDIPFYKIGTFGGEPDAFISREMYERYRSRFSFPAEGSILISAAGTIGRRVRYDGQPAYFQDSNIVWIENDESLVLNAYLYHYYDCCEWDSTTGATISRLYNDDLRRISVSFPKAIPEQRRIVARLDLLLEEKRDLVSLYERKLSALDELKTSILHQAFSGALTTKSTDKQLAEVA